MSSGGGGAGILPYSGFGGQNLWSAGEFGSTHQKFEVNPPPGLTDLNGPSQNLQLIQPQLFRTYDAHLTSGYSHSQIPKPHQSTNPFPPLTTCPQNLNTQLKSELSSHKNYYMTTYKPRPPFRNLPSKPLDPPTHTQRNTINTSHNVIPNQTLHFPNHSMCVDFKMTHPTPFQNPIQVNQNSTTLGPYPKNHVGGLPVSGGNDEKMVRPKNAHRRTPSIDEGIKNLTLTIFGIIRENPLGIDINVLH